MNGTITTLLPAMKDCLPGVVKRRPNMWAINVEVKRLPSKNPRKTSLRLKRESLDLKIKAKIPALKRNLTDSNHRGDINPSSQLVVPKPDPQNMAATKSAASAISTALLLLGSIISITHTSNLCRYVYCTLLSRVISSMNRAKIGLSLDIVQDVQRACRRTRSISPFC